MDARWQQALDYLYSFTNWETRRLGTSGDHPFELDRIASLLAAIDNPHRAWPAVHVGGTNGKGSTCVMVASVLRSAGYRVALYTSPHLHTVRERIQVDGRPIAEAEVIEWIRRRKVILSEFPGATTFEVLTAMAFEHFQASRVDIGIIEVGLGGRLDTTRVVEAVVTALTPISLDHREILGDTIELIASDKVGILRPGTPLVTAPQMEEAERVIEAERLRLDCPRISVGKDLIVERGGLDSASRDSVRQNSAGHVGARRVGARRVGARQVGAGHDDPGQHVARQAVTGQDAAGQRIRIVGTAGGPAGGPDGLLHTPFEGRLALEGPHQRVNAGVAAGICDRLALDGWRITRSSLRDGLTAARWPARFERFDLGPERAEIIVDGAHNPGSMQALRDALAELAPGGPLRLILGVGVGKDLDSMLDVLLAQPAPEVIEVIATRSEHPKAMAPDALAATIASRGLDVIEIDSPTAALEHALRESIGSTQCIVATGSLFLAADMREALAEMGVIDMPPRDPPPL